jgi:hypothetical protein
MTPADVGQAVREFPAACRGRSRRDDKIQGTLQGNLPHSDRPVDPQIYVVAVESSRIFADWPLRRSNQVESRDGGECTGEGEGASLQKPGLLEGVGSVRTRCYGGKIPRRRA